MAIMTQNEITNRWKNLGSPLLSINTIAYNHAKYIRQAFDSFLMQQTDFPFEVLVHDDASTDGTADIIREYSDKYPDIIKPVYQRENQYSKGIIKSFAVNYQRLRGVFRLFVNKMISGIPN